MITRLKLSLNMEKSFPKELSSLEKIFELVSSFAETHCLSNLVANQVYLLIEEIFTNLLKYNPHKLGGIQISLGHQPQKVVITLIDDCSEPFDIRRLPDPDIGQSPRHRKPGGLGLLLVNQIASGIKYEFKKGITKIVLTRKLEGNGV